MELFILGVVSGVIFTLLTALLLTWVHSRETQDIFDKSIKSISATPIFSGIIDDDEYIPALGEMVISRSRGVVVMGDGKTPIKDLPIFFIDDFHADERDSVR